MFTENSSDRTERTQATIITLGTCIFIVPLAAGLVLLPARQADAQVVKEIDPTGVYTLVSVDGAKLPNTVSHGNVEIEVRSGTFTINADGTCSSKTIFGPPSGGEVVREVTASYTQDGPTLTMQWKDAGRTSATVNGETFQMDNEGIVFSYKKQPGTDVLNRFVGTWRSVQTQGASVEEQDPVDLTYRRRLGGKFVQELGTVSGEDTAMIMYTYDTDQSLFRMWRFAATDSPSEATGKWNTDTNTLEWTYAPNAKRDFTMTARHRFVNDNVFEWDVVGRDKAGEILFQVEGKATRTSELTE